MISFRVKPSLKKAYAEKNTEAVDTFFFMYFVPLHSLVSDIPAGDGKTSNRFLQCRSTETVTHWFSTPFSVPDSCCTGILYDRLFWPNVSYPHIQNFGAFFLILSFKVVMQTLINWTLICSKPQTNPSTNTLYLLYSQDAKHSTMYNNCVLLISVDCIYNLR